MSAAVHLLDLRQQIIDNACLLYRDVPLNNFRILTSELTDQHGIHYHAYLTNIDLAAEEHRQLNGMLLNTEKANKTLREPAEALAALLLKTAMLINQWLMQNPSARE